MDSSRKSPSASRRSFPSPGSSSLSSVTSRIPSFNNTDDGRNSTTDDTTSSIVQPPQGIT